MMQLLTTLALAFSLLFAYPQHVYDADNWKVTHDEVVDGIRHVTAVPGGGVCSRRIELEIAVKGHVIRNAKFIGGCPGNTVGVCSLLKGMKVEDAIQKLSGIPCGDKPTSCPDQLSRVLKSLKW